MNQSDVFSRIKSIVESQNIDIYHIEYVKENNEYYLRVYIDKDGGVNINDCVEISKKISADYLDIEDPIKDAYNLEVSSPGIERILYTDSHLERYIGSDINMKLKSLHLGHKKISGKLSEFDDENIVVVSEETFSIPRGKIKRINLKGEF